MISAVARRARTESPLAPATPRVASFGEAHAMRQDVRPIVRAAVATTVLPNQTPIGSAVVFGELRFAHFSIFSKLVPIAGNNDDLPHIRGFVKPKTQT
jgi:hypothetical protein